jgi:hypothetical protein
MNTKKVFTGAMVSIALGSGGGSALAAIPGVPGEGALVPAVVNGLPDGANIFSYVALVVPEVIGEDTVISDYSAPHVDPGVQSFEGQDAIQWTLFDWKSKKIEDGYCDASPGDVVLWSTDPQVKEALIAQRRGLGLNTGPFAPDDIPDPVCGPTNTGWRLGYVVFQTYKGASREDADFAFSGYSSIIESGVLTPEGQSSIGSIPVLPMSDGADDVAPPGPRVGNEIINAPDFEGAPSRVTQASPILAGVRMNNADLDDSDSLRVEAPVQGPASGFGRSIHFFWFDRNNEDRYASTTGWDDHEGRCTNGKYMPWEMEVIIYNQYVSDGGKGWDSLSPGYSLTPMYADSDVEQPCIGCGEGWRTQLIDAMYDDKYTSDQYCEPPYWRPIAGGDIFYPGAFLGNWSYEFAEEGESPSTGGPVAGAGVVNAAMAAWNWQESLLFGGVQWSSHMSTDIGKLDN